MSRPRPLESAGSPRRLATFKTRRHDQMKQERGNPLKSAVPKVNGAPDCKVTPLYRT